MTESNCASLVELASRSSCLPAIGPALCAELCERYERTGTELLLCVLALCCCIKDGDVCLRLEEDGKALPHPLARLAECLAELEDENGAPRSDSAPEDQSARFAAEWGGSVEKFGEHELRAALQSAAVGGPEETGTPLVWDLGRLYFRRYFDCERAIAAAVRERGAREGIVTSDKEERARKVLSVLFDGRSNGSGPDLQKCAAALALTSPFTVISGGPGTGKTTTVTRLLLAMLTLADTQGKVPQVLLCAPTGKAAARLGESVSAALDEGENGWVAAFEERFGSGERISSLIPRRAQTVASLIGTYPHRDSSRNNRERPLSCDILVADEVSMIDMPLFGKLLDALPPDCQIILLGDKDQLCSVEAGSVLADLCASKKLSAGRLKKVASLSAVSEETLASEQALSEHAALLKVSHRFKADSAIGRLAAAVNNPHLGRAQLQQQVFGLLKESDDPDAEACGIFFAPGQAHACAAALADFSLGDCGYGPYLDFLKKEECKLDGESAAEALRLLDRYRILCSNRKGALGSEGLNRVLSARVRKALGNPPDRSEWFDGRVVLVTANNRGIGVANGDIGIFAHDKNAKDGKPDTGKVWFPDGDKARAVSPVFLTQCETGFAMTVHKSQGSEYERVSVCLSERDNSVLSRELVYTGITRAKNHVRVYASKDILLGSCLRAVSRESALAQRLDS